MGATVDTSDWSMRNQFHDWLDINKHGYATRSGMLSDKLASMNLKKVMDGDTTQRIELLNWLAETK